MHTTNVKTENNVKTKVLIDETENCFYICDYIGNIVAKFDSSGLHTIGIQANKFFDGVGRTIRNLSDIFETYISELFITDSNGFIKFKVSEDGVDWAGKEEEIGEIVNKKVNSILNQFPELPYDVCMHITDGQSLSVMGVNAGALDYSPALQLKEGIAVNYTAEQAADAAFVSDFYGNAFYEVAGTGFEGTCKRLMYIWNKLLKNENNQDLQSMGFQLIAASTGISGSNIQGLNKGTYSYTRTLQAVENAKRIANSQGKTFGVASFAWIQGESNYSGTKTAYYNLLRTLFEDFNEDIKAITKQTEDVQFFCYQPATYMQPWSEDYIHSGSGVVQAIEQLIQDKENVHHGVSMYNWYYSDQLHPGPSYGQHNPYAAMGATIGVKVKRLISDKKLIDFKLLSHNIVPKSDGTYFIELKFSVPVPPLVFDTRSSNTLWFCNPWGAIQNKGFSIKKVIDIDALNFLGSNNFYTLATAIAAVPNNLRRADAKIKFITGYGDYVTNTAEWREIAYDSSYAGWVQHDSYPNSNLLVGNKYNLSPIENKSFEALVDHAGCPSRRVNPKSVYEFYQGDPLSDEDWNNVNNWRVSVDEDTELITDVRIARNDMVILTCSENPTNMLLEYAKTGCMGGGNLKDSQGDTITVNIGGNEIPLYNWCPMFSEILD